MKKIVQEMFCSHFHDAINDRLLIGDETMNKKDIKMRINIWFAHIKENHTILVNKEGPGKR